MFLSSNNSKSETIAIKGNRDKTVDGNDKLIVNKNRKETINKSRSLNVDKNNTELVKMAKSVTVGLAYATQVGTVMNTAVGIMQTEQIGRTKKSVVGKSYSISVGDNFEITVGDSKIIMTKDSIHITSKTIVVGAEHENVIIGKDVLINPPGGVGGSDSDKYEPNIIVTDQDGNPVPESKIKSLSAGVPVALGAEAAAGAFSGAAGAACVSLNCPEAVVNTVKKTNKFMKTVRAANSVLVGSALGIFSSNDDEHLDELKGLRSGGDGRLSGDLSDIRDIINEIEDSDKKKEAISILGNSVNARKAEKKRKIR